MKLHFVDLLDIIGYTGCVKTGKMPIKTFRPLLSPRAILITKSYRNASTFHNRYQALVEEINCCLKLEFCYPLNSFNRLPMKFNAKMYM